MIEFKLGVSRLRHSGGLVGFRVIALSCCSSGRVRIWKRERAWDQRAVDFWWNGDLIPDGPAEATTVQSDAG